MRQLYYSILMLLRGRSNNLTKTISLTLGLFIGILLFACVAFQLSFNRFSDKPEQLYLAYMTDILNGVPGEGAPYMYGTFSEAMRENFPEQVEDATVWRDSWEMIYYHGSARLSQRTIYADNHLFSTMGIKVLAGNPEDLKAVENIFISRSLADKIREGAELSTVIGKQLYLEKKAPVTVRGIFEDLPENTEVPFHVVASMNHFWNNERAGWGFDISYASLIRFKNPEKDIPFVEARVPEMIKKYLPNFNKDLNNKCTIDFRPLVDLHTENATVSTMIVVMTILAIAILLIAAFNYVLISLSSLARRAKEVGVHKCNGAANGTIFGLFLNETILLILVSVCLTGGLMYLFHDFVEEMAAAKLVSLFTVQNLWVPGAVILFVLLLAGILPAWIFSSIPVTQVFRRYTERNTSWKRPLLFIQFIGVSFIFCFLLVVVYQYNMVVNRPLKYDPARVVTCWADVGGDYENRVTLFSGLPMVESYTCSSQLIIEGYSGDTFDTGDGHKVNTRLDWVTRSFLPMMKIKLIEGNNFSSAKNSESTWADNNELIVNQSFVRQAGWTGNVVGRVATWAGTKFTVVGVMEDYPINSAFEEQSPIVLVVKENWGCTHYIRLKEPFEENLAALNRTMQEIFPTDDVVFTSLEKSLEEQYIDVRRFRDVVVLASCSIFFITLMGLLGYVNDEVRRRSKEIAIRKVNGAEAGSIIRLLTREITWIAIPGVCLGALCAYIFGYRWLDSFKEQVHVSPGAFAVVIIFLLVIIAACIILRTWHIANENPVKSIKSE
ncbi:ABC transporter permease [Bacteroides sp.]|uniref:ABC transporter permease n=1 Tax=Bacteroides sp. TaxID=29523 RepID=UPI00261914BB|nr:ABC transporter permease [Bacteroides sp.]